MPTAAPSTKRKWSPWPVGIVLYFLSFFVLIVIFAIKASAVRFDLVAPDYYHREIQHDAHMAAAERARALKPPVRVEQDGPRLTLHIPEVHLGAFEGPGTLSLYRPSDAREDREFSWPAAPVFQVNLSNSRSGRYDIQLRWVMNGKDFYQSESMDLESP